MGTYVKSVYQTLAANADGSTTVFGLYSNSRLSQVQYLFHASGSFGGGTLTIQFLAADDTWKSISNASFTSSTDNLVLLPPSTRIRVVLTGATAPDLYYQFDVLGLNADKAFYTM